MVVRFGETHDQEFHQFNFDRAQAWLRGEVKDALVYLHGTEVCVEVPAGTENLLLAKAVEIGLTRY